MVLVAVLALAATLSHAPFSPSPGDWMTPRLLVPRPPRFEATGDDERLRVAWDGWTVEVRTTIRGGPRRWQRLLVTHPTHVEVRDTVTNATAATVGLRVRHGVATGGESIRLGGRADAESTGAYDPWNPTVFTPLGRAGVGLVVEDDVFRQQLYVDRDRATGSVSVRTDMLCLAPGDRYTMVWSVYPTRTPSYWDFINTVRDDWRVNSTVRGSHVWFTPDQVLRTPLADLRAALERRRASYASMLGGWIDPARAERPPLIGFGSFVIGPEFAAYRARLREALRKLKGARPEMTVLAYFDSQRDSSPDATRRYPDSVLVPPGHEIERVDWNGRFSPAWGMVPTAQNGFGRAMLAVARSMRALGADGLYWDEMDGVDYHGPRATRTVWDRRSCVLGEDGHVRETIGLVNLVSETAKLRYARTGVVFGNVPPTTRRFQLRPDLRMVEVHHQPGWSGFAHLTTPLAYIGVAHADWSLLVAQIDAGLLPVGAPWHAEFELPARLFPFTPEYLQPGTLRGRERIITTRSGTHGWLDGDAGVRTWRYDTRGHEHAARWRVKRSRGGVFVRVHLDVGEVAVIERASS